MAHSPGGEIGTLYANENPRRLVWAVLVDASIPSVFTDEQTAQMVATFPREMETRDKEGRTMAALFAVFPAMQHQFHTMHWPHDIPATVIVSEHPPLATPQQNAHWIQSHEAFAHAASNRSVIIAKGSSHLIVIDRPDLVSQAVSMRSRRYVTAGLCRYRHALSSVERPLTFELSPSGRRHRRGLAGNRPGRHRARC